ncbi:MAG: hypothetical protein ABSD61_01375 [Terracidiphilus sp.]
MPGAAAFDTSQPTLRALGTAATRRRFFSGPDTEDFNATLSQCYLVKEDRSLESRAEAFNVFNHAQFVGAPAAGDDISSGSFCQAVSAMLPRLLARVNKPHHPRQRHAGMLTKR